MEARRITSFCRVPEKERGWWLGVEVLLKQNFFFKIGETSVSLNIYDKNPVERELLTIQKRKRYLILYDS